MTITLTGTGPLLAHLPRLLGFSPRESLVVACLRRSGEVGLVMRVDVADCLIPDVAGPMSRTLAGHVRREAAEHVVLVCYSEVRAARAAEVLEAVRGPLAEVCGAISTWVVSEGRYRCPDCSDRDCCPEEGIPLLEQPLAGRGGGQPDLAGPGMRVARGKGHDGRPWWTAPAADRRRANRAAARWWAARERGMEQWRRESWRLWSAALRRSCDKGLAPGATEAGRLNAALRDLQVRDAAVLSLVPGGRKAALALLRGGGGGGQTSAALDAVTGPRGLRPEPGMEAGVDLLVKALTGHARRVDAAPAATLAAIMAWWRGEEAQALSWIERARGSQPDYRLAELLDAAIRCSIVPGWLRQKEQSGREA